MATSHEARVVGDWPWPAIAAKLCFVSLITLTTDFGTRDWFVGTMKGVIARVAPEAKVIDLTHDLPQGDIRAGAFALAASCRFLPKGTVHLAVVDPGVGSQRKAIAVQTADYLFVGPDNGLLSWALARERVQTVRAVQNGRYFLQPVSRTFHGRDVFAPVAAHLSRGVPLHRLGPKLEEFKRLPWPTVKRQAGEVMGEVVYIDRFGNVITNIGSETRSKAANAAARVFQGRRRLCPLAEFYQAVSPGRAVAVFGSSGFLEIAINGGNAARKLGLNIGDRIKMSA
jgi:S-adenosylmethionine hydrolase